MRLVDGSVDPVVISANTSIDHSPAWRPGAQQIAFVSERSGIAQIWIVDLEQEGDERFRVISESSNAQDSPAWSPDGKWLAWSQDENGIQTIFIIDISDPDAKPIRIGVGLRPQWNSTGNVILAEVHGPNETYLTGYDLNGGLALAPELLLGHLDGFTWGAGSLPDPLPNPIISAAQVTPSANLAAALDSAADDNSITNLVDVNAPFEQIHDSVLIPFEQLRIRAGQLLGWDALSELQNAYVPLGEPLPPDRQQDWLFTGRAFELHSALIDASWMAIVREELDGQTYWRVYLLAANDEGGLGRPMTEHPWVLSSRFNNTESAYISGGALSESIPAGYWIDFTALASEFGFERVPALGNWRSYYQGALFNLFVLRAGLSWGEAMLQIYSPEELATIQP
jgi:TolB protein